MVVGEEVEVLDMRGRGSEGIRIKQKLPYSTAIEERSSPQLPPHNDTTFLQSYFAEIGFCSVEEEETVNGYSFIPFDIVFRLSERIALDVIHVLMDLINW